MNRRARSGRRRPAGAPDFADILQLLEDGARQADIARRFGISPAAVCTGVGRARRLARLGLLGAGADAIAEAAQATGAPRSAVAALLGAAGRWTGPVAGVPNDRRFLRSIRGGYDWGAGTRRPAQAIDALRRAIAAKTGARRAPIAAGTNVIAAVLRERAAGRLDARGLARRLGLPGAHAAEALRYASIAGVVLACDLEIQRRAAGSGGAKPPAALARDAALVAAVAAAGDGTDATSLARQHRTTRWRISVARRAVEVAPAVRAASEAMR